MARKKKAKAADKADQFLQGLGTAGGPLGSPGLSSFGAGDLERQVVYGNTDNYWSLRDPQVSAAPMPQDLDASYLKLNLPGSPLPSNALFAVQNLDQSIMNQKMFLSEYQMTMAQLMPASAFQQLPFGYPPTKKK